MALALALLAALSVAGCGDEPAGLEWGFRFARAELADRAEVVEARILRGGCEGAELYEALLDVDDATEPSRPPQLPPGVFGLSGRARDAACGYIAAGCLEVTLPDDAREVQVVVLDDEPPPGGAACAPDRCRAGLCDGESLDAGSPDGGPPPQDAGTDAAEPPPDARVDAGRDAGRADAGDGGPPPDACASPELCNRMDDDCDGLTDEDFDLTSDRDHCGACGSSCGEGTCASGACVCAGALVWLMSDRSCRDLQTDARNCGAVGARCEDWEQCRGGACECRTGLTAAGPRCVDLQTDPANCGTVGRSCAGMGTMVTCRGGSCEDACSVGQTNCSNACVDVRTHPLHCGTCGRACNEEQLCRDGACKRYRVASACASCPCSACTGDFDRCQTYGGRTVCVDE